MSLLHKLSPQARLQIKAVKKRHQQKGRVKSLHDLPDPVDWIQENFYIPETNSPMTLYPSQEIPLRHALAIGDDGLFKFSTVCWGAIKKSAKSSIAAAVGLWFAFNNPWSSIKVVANDLKQAQSRSYEYMTRAIKLNPLWRDTVQINRTKILLPNNSTIEAIPQDPEGEAGGGDDFVLYTEIWGWKHTKAVKLWTESTLSPLKYGRSIRWAESYAGYEGESPILESLYETGVKDGALVNQDYEIYENGRTMVLWQTKPHLPWQSPEYYQQEAELLHESEYNRVHKNQWAKPESVFVPISWWDNCKVDYGELDHNEPVVIALDAAVSGDCFGMVAVSRIKEIDDNWQPVKDDTFVRFVRKWEPPKGGKIAYSNSNDIMDINTPEGQLRRLCQQFNVIAVVYDPYQLHDFCHRLGQDGIAYFNEFQQGKQRLIADKQLYDCIKERTIYHDGNSDLREHIENSRAKTEGEKLRIVKGTNKSLKVDLAVCLSMANNAIRELNY